jgi:hypothetical protein
MIGDSFLQLLACGASVQIGSSLTVLHGFPVTPMPKIRHVEKIPGEMDVQQSTEIPGRRT